LANNAEKRALEPKQLPVPSIPYFKLSDMKKDKIIRALEKWDIELPDNGIFMDTGTSQAEDGNNPDSIYEITLYDPSEEDLEIQWLELCYTLKAGEDQVCEKVCKAWAGKIKDSDTRK
jgi:hypothetical protein